MTILDYSVIDLQFSHWFKRKRQMLPGPVPVWLDNELDRLRPLRNPNLSCFVLDGRYGAE